MRRLQITPYDVAEHLRTPEEIALFLEACFEEGGYDAPFIAKALGDVARARGMTQVAKSAGLSRESLYKGLSGTRSPSLETVLRVLGALGLELRVVASDRRDQPSQTLEEQLDALEALAAIEEARGDGNVDMVDPRKKLSA
jgi:probable addiction module antidote protein